MKFKVKNKETGEYVSPRNYYFVLKQNGELWTINHDLSFTKANDKYEVIYERQENIDNSEYPDNKALHIADVSGRFSNSWNFAKYFEESKQYKRLTEVQKVEKDRIFLTATKIYDWLMSLSDH